MHGCPKLARLLRACGELQGGRGRAGRSAMPGLDRLRAGVWYRFTMTGNTGLGRWCALLWAIGVMFWAACVLADSNDAADDDLDAARWADRVGDGVVLERLGPETPALLRLRAIRAAPAMVDPERSLNVLADLMASRDPDLAPAAGRAAVAVAAQLSQDRLQRREASPEELKRIGSRYASLVESDLRQDIRLMAVRVAGLLDALLQPGG